MSRYTCLIVDDEPMARQIIESYCGNIKNLKVAASCENAFEASEVLSKTQIDILFLDINMPVINGLNFLKTLQKPPQVIITTAYKEYALDGFDLDVCDYLLKPISVERFLKAVQKAIKNIPTNQENKTSTPTVDNVTELVLKTETKTLKIPFAEILFLESQGNYSVITTEIESFKIYIPLYKIEESLGGGLFIRIHRSYIVSAAKIRYVDSKSVHLGKHDLPVGRKYKTAIKGWMKQ